MTKRLRIMSGQTQARKSCLNAASGLFTQTNCKITCCGKVLKPPYTKLVCVHTHKLMAENNNSGMVKVKWMITMDNPHALIERQRLNGDWWLTSHETSQLLKVQSSLQRKLKGYTDGWS